MSKRLFSILIVSAMLGAIFAATGALAVAPGNEYFQRTWQRTDLPVAQGQATRTWMWGPEAITGILREAYAESPGGMRDVQYFDKSRMEITQPGADANSIWYVTNGLLVVEMVTGRNQLGDNTFTQKTAAAVNVAGDAADTGGPTYATFASVLDATARALDPPEVIAESIGRDGTLTFDQKWSNYGVAVAYTDMVTFHSIAAPFWDFMNSSGTVYDGGSFVNAPLFQDPFFATGRPITEAYWATVQVGGAPTDVLIQCFERRCLTYTPSNAPEWRVESGNVGQHYHTWLYDTDEPPPPPPPATGPCPDSPLGGYIYVADQFNNRVQKFKVGSEYTFVCQFGGGTPPESFKEPLAVNVGFGSFIYVLAETGIHKYNYRGGFVDFFPLPDHSALDFAINSAGQFIVPTDGTIQVYSPSGELVNEFGALGSEPGQLDAPWGIAVDGQDRVFVVDSFNLRVQVFEGDGTFITTFGVEGDRDSNTEFWEPMGITVDSYGTVLVTDSGFVKMFGEQNGSFVPTGIWGGFSDDAYAADGAIEQSYGTSVAFVADNVFNTVDAYDYTSGENGAVQLISFGGFGAGPGQFNGPAGIAVAGR